MATQKRECGDCRHWAEYDDVPGVGDCRVVRRWVATAKFYQCDRWRQRERKQSFDVKKTADAVSAKNMPHSIVAISEAYNCTYQQAASVIEELRRRGVKNER